METNYSKGILSSIGNTPLIRLNDLFPTYNFQLYAKLECLNPSGSAKDRSAFAIMKNALECGQIDSNTTVIESSSGNFGIALAQICAQWKLPFICVVDPKTTQKNINILEAYGAKIDFVTEPDVVTGEYLKARLDRVNYLMSTVEHSFRPDQYSNLFNPIGHSSAAKEIYNSLEGRIDYVFCAVSTCGTIRGYREYFAKMIPKAKIIAVDAEGSIIFGGERKKRLIPGHGAGVVPGLFYPGIADDCVRVSDKECVQGCRKLMKTEGIMGGGSTGAVVTAIEKYADSIVPGSDCVMIVYDRGDRYTDTIYNDAWLRDVGLIF